VDVVISNCVVNLSPDKAAVYREAFRALKPGGRLAISDVITTAPLPPEVRADLDLLTSCIAGAASLEDIEGWLAEAGFQEVRISPKDSRALVRQWAPGANVEDYVCSANIEAIRP
jgi:arsenite methyltransferase